MNTPFSFNHSEDGTESIVLLGSQGVRVVPDSHINYDTIKDLLLGSTLDADESVVYDLTDAATKVQDELQRLSDRVTIRGDTIFFDGDEMETRLTRHIVDMIRAGDSNYGGYVMFLENVHTNPSRKSRKGLFRFLEDHDLIITDDGHFIGYKGVGTDGRSTTAGKEDVTVTLPDGTVNVVRGNIPNPVGAVVEMPRSLVDPDKDSACSVGLHVADFDFASNWASKLLTVKVNPRDVVEVPNDGSAQKVRVHRYTVLEENAASTRYGGTSWPATAYDYDYDEYGEEDDVNQFGL